MKKKLIGLVVVVMCVAAGMGNINISAEDAIWRPSDAGLEYDDTTLNKYVEPVQGLDDTYDVTMEITAKNLANYPGTDIVFVVDESNSMAENDRFNKVVNTVNTFSDKLLSISTNVNVAVVSYGDNVTATLPFTKSATDVSSYMAVRSATGGGTFTQAGLKQAEDMLSLRPAINKKVIILLSDGVPTYAYKTNATAALSIGEVSSVGSIVPTYKATGFDYATRVGDGGNFSLIGNGFMVGSDVVTNNADPTIGEILDYKQDPNNTIYTLGIELNDGTIQPDMYTYDNTVDITKESVIASWDEEVRDLVISPNEISTYKVTYVNNDTVAAQVSYEYNLNDFQYPYFVNDGSIVATIKVDGNIVDELTYDELKTMADSTFPVKENVNPGGTYEMEVTLKAIDYTGQIAPLNVWPGRFNQTINSSGRTAFTFNFRNYVGPVLDFYSELDVRQQAEYLLRNVSSDGIEGSTYFDVDNADDLLGIVSNNVLGDISNSVVDGVVSSPIGSEHIDFVAGGINGRDATIEIIDSQISAISTYAASSATVSYNPSTNAIDVNGLNLTPNQKAIIKYRIHLNTDAEGFESNKAYPVSSNPTLMPRATGVLRAFPVPTIVGVKKTTPATPTDPTKPKDEIIVNVNGKDVNTAVNTNIYMYAILLGVSTISLYAHQKYKKIKE